MKWFSLTTLNITFMGLGQNIWIRSRLIYFPNWYSQYRTLPTTFYQLLTPYLLPLSYSLLTPHSYYQLLTTDYLLLLLLTHSSFLTPYSSKHGYIPAVSTSTDHIVMNFHNTFKTNEPLYITQIFCNYDPPVSYRFFTGVCTKNITGYHTLLPIRTWGRRHGAVGFLLYGWNQLRQMD